MVENSRTSIRYRVKDAIGRGWSYWRYNRRSYLLALFGSIVVPFGIFYSGIVATVVVALGWVVFLVVSGMAISEIDEPNPEWLVRFMITGATLCLLHVLMPIVAVAFHNRKVKRMRRS